MSDHTTAPTVFDAAFWHDFYSSKDAVWSGHPNPVLVDEVAGLEPGTALDIGCGEGADSLWLADQGWTVTGVDISQIALDRAAAHQGERAIEWIQADLLDWTPPVRAFDLVSAQFFQLPPDTLDDALRTFADAVAPGGHLLVVGHSPQDPAASNHQHFDILFGPETVTAALGAGWTTIHSEHRTRPAAAPTASDARPENRAEQGGENRMSEHVEHSGHTENPAHAAHARRVDTVVLLRRASS